MTEKKSSECSSWKAPIRNSIVPVHEDSKPETARSLVDSPSAFPSQRSTWSSPTHDSWEADTRNLRGTDGATCAPSQSGVDYSLRRDLIGSQRSAFTSDPRTYRQAAVARISNPVHQNMAQTLRTYDSHTQQAPSRAGQGYGEYNLETQSRGGADLYGTTRHHNRRNRDEFEGPVQVLPLPDSQQEHAQSEALPSLPVHLSAKEQDDVLMKVNTILSNCAYHFVAKHQFPIPLKQDKPRVQAPADRKWIEWAHLLKRLATKRRIPARVLYDNQIKQFVTTLENSIPVMRQSDQEQQTRSPMDDRYILQYISAAIQVAKIVRDSSSMKQLDMLYKHTEIILEWSHRYYLG